MARHRASGRFGRLVTVLGLLAAAVPAIAAPYQIGDRWFPSTPLTDDPFVADALYFTGEAGPNDLPGRGGLRPVLPAGYDYDGCDASVVLTPRFDARIVMDAISTHSVTVLFAVPAVLRRLLDDPGFGDRDLSSVRMVFFGGAIGSLDVLPEFAAAVGREDIIYQQMYGLTEGGPFVTV